MHSLYLMAAAFLTINVSCSSISVNSSISVTTQSIATNKTQSANMTILTSSTRSIPPSSLVPVNMTLTSSRRQTQIPTSSPVPVTSIMTSSRRQTQIPTSSPVPVTSTMTSSTRPITTSSSVPVIITVISSPSSTVTPVMPTTIAPSYPAVLRCYTMQITLSYNISKDLSISSLNPSFLKYTIILTTTNFMDLLNSCKNVEFTIKSTQLSRVDNSTAVELRIMLKFSAKSQIPDNDVEERLTKCLGELQESRYIGLLKNASLALTILGHQWYDEQSIQIHPSASCCGIGIKLPCCPASSIRWSSSCVPLYFADFIQNKQVRLGDTVQASCAVTTGAKVKIAWKRNKTILLSSVNGFNSTLIINNVGTSDAGVYHCQVKNDFQIITKPFYLKIVVYQDVEMKLTLVEAFHPDLLNSTSATYKTFRHFFIEQIGGALRKTFKHLDKIEVQRFSEGSVIVDFKVYLKKIFTTPTSSPPDLEGEVISAMLNLENFGNLSANSLVFKVKPPPPINIQIVGRGTSYIVLSWQPPQGWQSFQITDYIVRYTVVNRLDWKAIKVTVDKSNLKVPSLKTNTKYQIQMVSRGKLGDGKPSDLLSATTLTDSISSDSLLWLLILVPIVILGGISIFLWYRRREIGRHNENRMADEIGIGVEETGLAEENDIGMANEVQIGVEETELAEMSPSISDDINTGLSKWLEIPRESINLGDKLGSGQFGEVLEAEVNTGGEIKTCAVKRLKKNASVQEKRDLFQELEIICNIGSHSNLVDLIGACTKNGPLLIVIELARNGSLIDYLKNSSKEVNGNNEWLLNDELKLNFGLDIAKGMQHLAYKRCVHRDLAARNVLLTERGQAKISDFGLSRDAYERGYYRKKTEGKLPIRWMAPEAIEKMLFTSQSDVWSYGVVLWEIETRGSLPYAGAANGMEILKLITTEGYRLERPPSCKQDVYDIMIRSWQKNPRERPSFDQLCSNMEELLQRSRR